MAEDNQLIIANSGNNKISFGQQIEMKENFEKQVNFIQTSLDLTDEDMDKTKMVDLPNLVKKAQQEVTIGKMKKMMNIPEPKRGVLGSMFFWLAKMLS